MKKRFFVEVLKEICAEEGLIIEIFSYEWLCKITDSRKGVSIWTEGYNFGLNSDTNYLILNDKVSTSEVLANSNVPHIPHFLIMRDSWREALQIDKTWEEELLEIMSKIGDNVVVKPTTGSQGKNVFLCKGKDEVYKIVSELKVKTSISLSKYFESEFEYRFYVLNSEVLFAYKKIKNQDGGSWQHNLSQGAKAEMITVNFSKYNELIGVALKSFNVLGINCGAVDILDTQEGLKVIEVNNGIMMDSFAATSPEYYQIAKEAHKKMLYKALQR